MAVKMDRNTKEWHRDGGDTWWVNWHQHYSVANQLSWHSIQLTIQRSKVQIHEQWSANMGVIPFEMSQFEEKFLGDHLQFAWNCTRVLYQVYVDNVQIFRQKFNAVPELQAFNVTYRTPFLLTILCKLSKYNFLRWNISTTNDSRTIKLSGIIVIALFKHLSTSDFEPYVLLCTEQMTNMAVSTCDSVMFLPKFLLLMCILHTVFRDVSLGFGP